MLEQYQFNYSLKYLPERPLILFLHGFMGNLKVFDDIIQLLDSQFSCLAIDLPGHGLTEITGKEKLYNIHNISLALIELLDSLSIDKCYLLGYSMGGRLALYLTINFPQYFKKVILESASPGLKTAAERDRRKQKDFQLATQLESHSFVDFLTDWYDNSLFSSLQQNPNFSQLFRKRLNNNPDKLAKVLRNLSTGCQPSLWTKLKDNPVPTLLIVGESDRKFIKINREMLALCSAFQINIVKGCGHNIHWENPQQFANIIRNFFLS